MFGRKKRVMINIASQNGYDITTALRGPDFRHSGSLKSIFTERIRHLVGVGNDVMVMARENRIVRFTAERALEEAEKIRAAGSFNGYSHYLGHVASAAIKLGDNDLANLARLFNTNGDLPDVDTIISLAGGD